MKVAGGGSLGELGLSGCAGQWFPSSSTLVRPCLGTESGSPSMADSDGLEMLDRLGGGLFPIPLL